MFSKYLPKIAICCAVKVFFGYLMISDLGLVIAEEVASVGKLRSSADMAFSQGSIDEAIKLWEQVIAIEPNNDSNFYKRFRVYLRQKKYKEALADLSKALLINSKHENALVQRAKLQTKLGKCAEAVQDFQSLQVLNPENKELKLLSSAQMCANAIQGMDMAYGKKNYAQAKIFATDALGHAENSVHIYLRRAWCHYFTGDLYESIADTGKVLKVESNHMEALELRGRAYYVLG